MPTTLTCPRCSSAMENGLIVDKGDGNVPGVGWWLSGVPERNWGGWLKTKGRDKRAVSTWRCRRCGYLESYAEGPTL